MKRTPLFVMLLLATALTERDAPRAALQTDPPTQTHAPDEDAQHALAEACAASERRLKPAA